MTQPPLFRPKLLETLSGVSGSIVAMVVGTLAVLLFNLPVETVGSRFGGIPQNLPGFEFPDLSWSSIQHLIQPAFTIALLAAIESLLSGPR